MVRLCWSAVVLCLLLSVGARARAIQADGAAQAQEPAWKTAIAARRQQLIDQNGPGTDAALRDQLMQMREQDQVARGLHNATPAAGKGSLQIATNLAEIDAALTTQLKGIVASKGWPTIALVGINASDAALLLLNHSADHAWQRELVPQLEALADDGKIDGSNLAGVVDKELVSEGKPQRYGTQFRLVDGEMRMYSVENPGGLDALRARTLLPPIDVYKQQMTQIYHLKVSEKLASPQAPSTN